MPLQTKCRSFLNGSTNTILTSYVGPKEANRNVIHGSFVGTQRTTSSSHKWPPKKGASPVDSGGAFFTQKVEFYPGGETINEDSGISTGVWYRLSGPVYASYSSAIGSAADFAKPSSDSQLDAIGSLLMSRALPTNPLSGMGQFLGELRNDGIPSLPTIKAWRNRAAYFKRLAKSGSDEYLNVQFGWVPFINDIVDFCSVVKNASKHIQQYQKNSGQPVYRRRSLPEETSTTVTSPVDGYPSPSGVTPLYASAGKYTRSTVTSTKRWASFCFTYYLPPDDGTIIGKYRHYEALANKLFGLRITPDLLWKLAPWSWAVDWVTNTGALIRNWSAFQNDGLVLRYGYVMEQITVTRTDSLQGVKFKSGRILNLNQVKISTTKSRRRATPYGFGLNPQSFSAFQWSIIAALGISKAPRSLDF